eukprot:CAMPEP_0202966894 /NCGR_PEP_ID=MMETSP1396-20130829/11545_1 /ASSEMBLY_ACC=CAM_ASM_000872 /TAXON_ID= /ORGANISM="Pseudokeronopsis sp., Strain Brazil" /LENGTH=50 /DNA_ID=CAMNT_0049691317 /DNA_START=520 /DNA_END=668 /DNA_ORIENTATION=-
MNFTFEAIREKTIKEAEVRRKDKIITEVMSSYGIEMYVETSAKNGENVLS